MNSAGLQDEGSIDLRKPVVELGGRAVLNDVTLKVAAGERVAFIGPSGAGKTTLLRLINGMVSPQSGQVFVGSQEVTNLGSRDLRRLRSRIGFIHQDLRLVPNLRVSQNVLSGRLGAKSWLQSLRMFLRPAGADLDTVYRLLQRVGIPDKIFQRTDQLSGGEAQRVAIARALIQDPVVLIADEPVASVDPARAREVLELLVELCEQEGLTLCVSLHDPDLVKEFFPRVIGLREGRIVFDAPTAEVTTNQLAELYALEPNDGF